MKRKIIFDFNRTLFDPESDKLDGQATLVLEELKNRGYELFLISHGVGAEEFLEELGIKAFFKDFAFVEEKTPEQFRELVGEGDAVVVGDRVRYEIKIGNSLGFKTVWLKKGLFSTELPEREEEKPDFIIESLEELLILKIL